MPVASNVVKRNILFAFLTDFTDNEKKGGAGTIPALPVQKLFEIQNRY
jgi:hypothetical protein